MTSTRENEAATPLVIILFGPLAVQVDGHPLPRLRSHKEQWLLALLILHSHRPVERDWLAGTLWPESAESQAAYNLRRSLSNLRQALGTQAFRLLSPTTHSLQFDLSEATVDVLAFDQAIAQGDPPSLENAVALHSSPLLEGCTEEWAVPERQAREQAYLNALETLAAHAMNKGDASEAVGLLRRVVSVEPLRESAQRALMEALSASGDQAAAILTYRDLRLLLRRELNAEPDPETSALFAKLRMESGSQAQPALPVLAVVTSSVTPRHLPSPLTSLVGREQEIAEVRACLQAARLVTLTGTGGVGKTRLAIEVGQQIAAEYAEGVRFVDLAPLTDSELVVQVVASTLGLREEAGRPLQETLAGYLRSRHLLLILDSCEHLIQACAQLADRLLQNCPHLRILATSRQALGLIGEVSFRVPSLALPPSNARRNAPHQYDSPEGEDGVQSFVMRYEALRLFADRARQALPTFHIDARNVEAIGRICHQLDGIPLALELAAARVKAMPVEQIATRLDDRFRLMTGSNRTALPRQQTLHGLFDWSYNLLSEPEQALLRRLSVFAGGWTLEAAEQVTGYREQETGERQEGAARESGAKQAEESNFPGTCNPSPVTSHEVLDLLTSLVEKSLVIYDYQGEARYRLLETVGRYAGEKLTESGEETEMRKRHRDYFLHLAEEAEPNLQGPDQAEWLRRLEREHDNLRTALALEAADEESWERGMRLAGALWKFWETRGYLSEGRAHLKRVLSPPGEPGHAGVVPIARTGARAKALYGAAGLAYRQGDYDTARALFERSLTTRRKLGDMHGTANTLISLGVVALQQGDYIAARSLQAQSLSIQRELGDKQGIANALNNLGLVLYSLGDYATAQAHYEECLAIKRELGDRLGIANALDNLGNVAYEQGNYETARSLYDESLDIEKALDHRRGIATTLYHLGDLACSQEDYATAWDLHEESLAIRQELGDKQGIALSLQHMGTVALANGDYTTARENLIESLKLYRQIGHRLGCASALGAFARLLSAQEQPEWAVRLFGVAEALRESLAAPHSREERAREERSAARAREMLGETAFAVAWAEGREMDPEQAMQYALRELIHA